MAQLTTFQNTSSMRMVFNASMIWVLSSDRYANATSSFQIDSLFMSVQIHNISNMPVLFAEQHISVKHQKVRPVVHRPKDGTVSTIPVLTAAKMVRSANWELARLMKDEPTKKRFLCPDQSTFMLVMLLANQAVHQATKEAEKETEKATEKETQNQEMRTNGPWKPTGSKAISVKPANRAQ